MKSPLTSNANQNARQSAKWLNTFNLIIVSLAILPMIGVVWKAMGDASDVWPHLFAYVLPQSTSTTLILLIGVAFLAVVFGSTTSWLTSQYNFPFKNTYKWALVMPLAIPTYISAYTYGEFLDFTGPVQTFYRDLTGYTSAREYWFPDIRSTTGAVFLMSLVLYPYVYLPARLSFQMQNASLNDVARVLGAGPVKIFFRVALPAARPAIAVGVMLALMEALNDIGAVEYLGVRTLTFSIYDTWLNRSSLAGAAQIALMLLVVVAFLMYVENKMRAQQKYSDPRNKVTNNEPTNLRGLKAALASLWCFIPLLLGFLVPFWQLLKFSFQRLELGLKPELYQAAANSVLVAILTAIVCTCSAFLIVYAYGRVGQSKQVILKKLAGFGYAVPGTILALGTIAVVALFDNSLDAFMQKTFGIKTGLLFSGSVVILVYASSVRFLTIAMGNIETGYSKISSNLSSASRTLGRTEFQSVKEIDLPLLRPAFATAMLLVLVDTMKELSATLLLRPFNFNTLSTYVYELASRALFEDAAIAALMIVIIGLVPVYLLTKLSLSEK